MIDDPKFGIRFSGASSLFPDRTVWTVPKLCPPSQGVPPFSMVSLWKAGDQATIRLEKMGFGISYPYRPPGAPKGPNPVHGLAAAHVRRGALGR
jgi:hypothetical protein